MENVIYRIVQEALTNARNHSKSEKSSSACATATATADRSSRLGGRFRSENREGQPLWNRRYSRTRPPAGRHMHHQEQTGQGDGRYRGTAGGRAAKGMSDPPLPRLATANQQLSHSRLSLRESSATFAERKATLISWPILTDSPATASRENDTPPRGSRPAHERFRRASSPCKRNVMIFRKRGGWPAGSPSNFS